MRPCCLPSEWYISSSCGRRLPVPRGCKSHRWEGSWPPRLFPFAVIVLYKTLAQVMLGDV